MYMIVRISILSTHLKHDVEIKLGPAVESRLKTHGHLKRRIGIKTTFYLLIRRSSSPVNLQSQGYQCR